MDMTAGRPAALLFRFSMPLIFGNLFQQLYTFVDTVIVGQKLGVPALAALGATEWLSFMMFGFIQGLTQGFSIGISQSFGEGKKHLVQQGIFQAFCASAGAAVIVTVIGQGILVPVLKLLRTPEELFGMAHLYLEILYFGIPISFAYNMLAAILRALGNSRAPLIAVLTASFANILFEKWEKGRKNTQEPITDPECCFRFYLAVRDKNPQNRLSPNHHDKRHQICGRRTEQERRCLRSR